MDNEKRNFLSRFNPGNYKIATKIQIIIFGLFVIAFAIILILGRSLLRGDLIRTSARHMQELAYLKAKDIDHHFTTVENRLLEFSEEPTCLSATKDLESAFSSISDDHRELFGADSIVNLKKKYEAYFRTKLVPLSPLSGEHIMELFPQQDLSLVSQYLYIYLNPKPQKEKSDQTNYDDKSAYAQAHSQYHKYFSRFIDELNAKDLYLVDPKNGNVVYSYAKNLDFGTNLYDGVERTSPLAIAFQKALARDRKEMTYVDYSNYAPAFDEPVGFLSIPVFSYDQIVGVLIVQIGPEFFDHALFDNYQIASQSSMDFSVIGADFKLRNDPKAFLHDPEKYENRLTRIFGRKKSYLIDAVKKLGTPAMITSYPGDFGRELLNNDNVKGRDFYNRSVVAAAIKIRRPGTDLYVVAKTDLSEVLMSYHKNIKIVGLIFFLLLLAIFIIGKWFGHNFANRVTRLRDALIQLYRGEEPKELEKSYSDEMDESIEAYNLLKGRISETSEFIVDMSNDNLKRNFEIISDKDVLGRSLNALRDKMVKSKEEHETRVGEDEIRHWINTGVAKFNDLLRQSSHDINELSFILIEELVSYLDANQGGVFLVESRDNEKKVITQTAAFAYDRRKYNQKTIEIGEGLLGNVYLEKKSVYLKDIPNDYLEITSGLGQSNPRCLYIMPLMVDDDVLGLIEIASFNEFEKHHIDFIEKVAESIAATFVNVRLNMQTSSLLTESNRRAEEIAQQEEEMRQNLEEMQATQEELARLRQDDEQKTREMQLSVDNSRKMLRNMLNSIPGGFVLKDANGIIHLTNKEGADFYGMSPEAVVGKTDHELLGAKLYEVEHRKDLEVLDKGEQKYDDEKESGGKKIKYKVIKKPFYIDELRQQGVLTIRYKA